VQFGGFGEGMYTEFGKSAPALTASEITVVTVKPILSQKSRINGIANGTMDHKNMNIP